jgi:hypothetical protein
MGTQEEQQAGAHTASFRGGATWLDRLSQSSKRVGAMRAGAKVRAKASMSGAPAGAVTATAVDAGS